LRSRNVPAGVLAAVNSDSLLTDLDVDRREAGGRPGSPDALCDRRIGSQGDAAISVSGSGDLRRRVVLAPDLHQLAQAWSQQRQAERVTQAFKDVSVRIHR